MIEWTEQEREAALRAICPTDHPLGHGCKYEAESDRVLAALAPHVEAMIDQARAEGAHQALHDAARDCPLDDVSQILDFLSARCREASERAAREAVGGDR